MKKKSILFIADKPNWAYHNLIKTWATGLTEFDCYIAFEEDFLIRSKKFSFVEKLLINNINVLRKKEKSYNIDRSLTFSFPNYKYPPVYEVNSGKKVNLKNFDIIYECAFYFQFMAKIPFVSNRKYVGIYTDSFPHEGPNYDAKTSTNLHELNRKEFFTKYLQNYDGIIVGNSNLLEDYKSLSNKIVFANGIFRQDDFIENKNVGKNDGLTIGWTGNPNRAMKGFREVIEPAIELVKSTGRKINLKTKFTGSYDEILEFYTDVDLIVIASEADTGPSLFAEASLSNVPSISTRIGFPKMIIQDRVNGIFVNRDINEIRDAIIELYDDRELLSQFSNKIKSDYLKQLDNSFSIQNLKKLFS